MRPISRNASPTEGPGLLQIRFVDHVVVGESAPGRCPYFSFREAGLIS
jgi:DNA repair protein RadC